ncbi:MAG: PBECR4 domain-containing protein [Oscillospiraceae bacterium]|nr:PBECR4 domain-containing protein [Oscillospiraceae bacterium]
MMYTSQDKKAIVQLIKDASITYKKYLVGRKFMYVFDSRYIEVIYKSENFRHLTGVKSSLPAKAFYRNATRNLLTESDIGFDSVHPFSLCAKKLKHIDDVAKMATSECIILEEIQTDTMSYKFGTTDLNFTLCLNHDKNKKGEEINDGYVVQSLRDGDCFSRSKAVYTVSHIFVKGNDDKKYSELLYSDNSVSIEDLPDEILTMLDDKLKDNKTKILV